MPTPDGMLTTDDWKATEYNALKSEQRDRIKFRDGLFFAAFLLYGGLGGYALGSAAPPDTWILLGFVAGLAGHLYLENEVKISGIRDFLKDTLGSQLQWEGAVDKEVRRLGRKRCQLLVDLIAFAIPAVSSIWVAWCSPLAYLPVASKGVVLLLGIYVGCRSVFRHIERYERNR